MHSKVALICCYFGKLPVYFQLWLNSCAYNSNFNWMVFTDSDCTQYICPSNVSLICSSLDEIKKLIRDNTNICEKIDSPYKLCDFKPLYGLIFKRYLEGFSHWGHCDLDVIWGNLDKFITDNMLVEYDRLFQKGHLIIYKNDEVVNNYYKLPYAGVNYREVLESPFHYGFDEFKGMNRIYLQNNISWYDHDVSADIDFYHYPLKIRGKDNFEDQSFGFDKGHIFRMDKNGKQIDEFPYIHLQKRHMSIAQGINPERFYIGESRFYSAKTPVLGSEKRSYYLKQKIKAIKINLKWNIHWRKKYKRATSQNAQQK